MTASTGMPAPVQPVAAVRLRPDADTHAAVQLHRHGVPVPQPPPSGRPQEALLTRAGVGDIVLVCGLLTAGELGELVSAAVLSVCGGTL